MYETIQGILENPEFSVIEKLMIPGQDARYAKIPRFLFDSPVGAYLDQHFPNGLYLHQTEALEALGKGNNVVTSTSTASGKSLIFRAISMHKVLLDPNSRVIVFYPLRALVEDQLRGWREMAEGMGLSADFVGRIDGTVRPFELRDEVLKSSRIVVMTPDVLQSWMMARLAMPIIKSFVGAVSTIVMDEAHTLEGVFGSNFAFLIRRLIAARGHILGQGSSSKIQLVAATATIENPGGHMKRLTGSEFVTVDHTSDGSKSDECIIAHVACSDGREIEVAQELQQRVIADGQDGSFITFVDSRKGVETLAMATDRSMSELLGHPAINSYRSGYKPQERRKIENDLRIGKIRGVVSTSALELGIDFPSLTVGFNLGIPTTRKAYRQRLGRVGRSGPGAFILIGPPNLFRQYGTTLEEYHDMSVEPSYLYLDNRFMQFAHGRCLADERDALAASSGLPNNVNWPDGFKDSYDAARPGGNRPREYDAMAQLGGDTPHLGYPMRNIGEPNFQIKLRENSDPLGDSNLSQALRESYPGATYFHNMRPYYVAAWHTLALEQPYIRVRHGNHGRSTRPRIRTWINAAITSDEVLDGNLIRGQSGFIAECQMLITEKVDGYFDGRTGEFHSYQELQQTNPLMKPRSRNFRTTGVVICIQDDWFKVRHTPRIFVDRLREIFIHEYSISSQDVSSAYSNISIKDGNGQRWRSGCVTIFDEIYGSLRFTEKLYREFDHILEKLIAAVDTDLPDDIIDLSSIARKVRSTTSGFKSASPFEADRTSTPKGYEMVFKEGSVVCYREKGTITEDVEVIQASMVDDKLRYQIKAYTPSGQRPVRRWIVADRVEPSADADAWELGWWNLETEEFEEPFDEDAT